ncbi:MAG: DNA polymerase III subunit delta [Patescibacteria group bacterium]
MFLAVYGEDSLRVREFAEDLMEKFVAKYDPSRLNVEVFDFATVTKEVLIPSLQAAPFLAEKRFIFLKNVGDTLKKSDAPFWTDVFGRLDGSTSLCFVDELSDVAWKKSNLSTLLGTKSAEDVKYFPVPVFSRTECIAWIRARAARLSADMSEQVAGVLFARVGGTGQELAVEIHKLAAYAAGGPITENMIERLVPSRISSDFFAFLDLLPTASPERLTQSLRKELESGTDAFGLFGGLLRQLRVLVGVSSLGMQGVTSQKEIADALALHPFVAQKAISGAKAFSHQALVGALDKAIAWDKRTKSGISAEIMVDRLIEELLFARIKPVS